MKTLFIALTILSSTAFAAVDGGQQNVAQSAVSSEDALKIRQEIKQFGAAFGVQAPTSTAPAQAPKSMADVADKALDMMGGLVANISQVLAKVAPEIWRIMIRQQYAKAVADTATPLLLLLMCGIYTLIMRKLWKRPDHEHGYWSAEFAGWVWTTIIAPTVFGIIFFIWSSVAISDAMKYVINPEFYAVKDILTMLINPGALQ